METVFDFYASFPLKDSQKEEFESLINFCGSVESFEQKFGIELSCGDGLFLSDLMVLIPDENKNFKWKATEEQIEKYDGKVCYESSPRFIGSKKPLKAKRNYRFTVKKDKNKDGYSYEDFCFYLNSKKL